MPGEDPRITTANIEAYLRQQAMLIGLLAIRTGRE